MAAIVAKVNSGAANGLWTETVILDKAKAFGSSNISTRWPSPSFGARLSRQDTISPSKWAGRPVSKGLRGIRPVSGGIFSQHFVKMCSLDHWERAWVMQEVILGRDIVIWQGDLEIGWSDFSKVWICLMDHAEHMVGNASAGFLGRLKDTPLAPFFEMVKCGRRAKGVKLGELIEICGSLKCSDVRDRIFSLLSMAKDCTQITANYHLSPLQLLLKMVEMRSEFQHDCFLLFQSPAEALGPLHRLRRVDSAN